MSKVKAAFFCNNEHSVDYVYAAGRRELVSERTELYPEIVNQNNFAVHAAGLADVEVIFTTWGFWALSDAELAALPKLKAVFYAAGATDYFARPLLARGIEVCSAWQANAIPVAEFCVAQILLGLKGYFRNSRELKSPEKYNARTPGSSGPGIYGETVALIGAGAIAVKVQEMLKPFKINVIVVPSRPERRTVSLEEAFARAFVVSNHLPNREDNIGCINGRHFRAMREGAVFINTGRGAQVNEADMVEVMRERRDLTALLDVTWPEPPVEESAMYDTPNIHMSSHIAGSLNDEVVRMADYMLDEFDRWSENEPRLYRVSEEMLMTH